MKKSTSSAPRPADAMEATNARRLEIKNSAQQFLEQHARAEPRDAVTEDALLFMSELLRIEDLSLEPASASDSLAVAFGHLHTTLYWLSNALRSKDRTQLYEAWRALGWAEAHLDIAHKRASLGGGRGGSDARARSQRVRDALRADPNASTSALAVECGVSERQVRKIKSELRNI
jgi:hypothetical protein